jgi:hypothetical protein
MDIYLIGSGVKRRVFETLSGFGVCHSYKQANRIMGTIAEDAEVCWLHLINFCKLLQTSTNSCKLLQTPARISPISINFCKRLQTSANFCANQGLTFIEAS